jgi:catechol 2,3-dioxygenase-like lactoylglutathione lyase family enzyme
MVWNTNFVDVYSANLAWLSVEKCVFFVSFDSLYFVAFGFFFGRGFFRVVFELESGAVRGRSGARKGGERGAWVEPRASQGERTAEALGGGGVRLQRRPGCGAWSGRTSSTHDQLGAGADESVRVRVRTFVKAGSSAEPKSAGDADVSVRRGTWDVSRVFRRSQTFIRVCAKQGRGVPWSWTTRLAGRLAT